MVKTKTTKKTTTKKLTVTRRISAFERVAIGELLAYSELLLESYYENTHDEKVQAFLVVLFERVAILIRGNDEVRMAADDLIANFSKAWHADEPARFAPKRK